MRTIHVIVRTQKLRIKLRQFRGMAKHKNAKNRDI